MATRKTPPRKAAAPPPPAEVVAPAGPEEAGEAPPPGGAETPTTTPMESTAMMNEESLSDSANQEPEETGPAATETGTALEGAVQPEKEHEPRFHFFIIDTGWKSIAAKVIRENFPMIREFQNNDPLYILSREQSIAMIRANADLIGKDPIILVHDLHAKGGRGESGYHGFRLCLGLIKKPEMALFAMQQFLRFVHSHRRSADIEKDIKEKLHRAGIEGAIEVLRSGAQELVGG